jgi:hypothetical protein
MTKSTLPGCIPRMISTQSPCKTEWRLAAFAVVKVLAVMMVPLFVIDG